MYAYAYTYVYIYTYIYILYIYVYVYIYTNIYFTNVKKDIHLCMYKMCVLHHTYAHMDPHVHYTKTQKISPKK